MLYYQTKFGCTQTSSLEDIVKKQSYFDYISPCCDLDIEDSAPIFPRDTSPHENTPPYKFDHTKFGEKKWLSNSGDIQQTRSDTTTDRQMDGWT